ncbi:MAG: hypothetical protein MRY74_13905 [Neomegalonema sp.]|nr:hypothetical protein [Neomegalonema sp.]
MYRFMNALRICLIAGASSTVGISTAAAHPEGEGVIVLVMSAKPNVEAPGSELLSIYVSNRTAAAVTLRGLSADGRAISLERKRGLFGYETWQRVKFIRLEPGKTLLLDQPAYRVILHAGKADATKAGAQLHADFGAAGTVSTPLKPGAAPAIPPATSPSAPGAAPPNFPGPALPGLPEPPAL